MGIMHKKCTRCGSNHSLKIIYGKDNFDLIKDNENGKIRLSLEEKTETSPEYYCKDCQNEWNSNDSINIAYSRVKNIKLLYKNGKLNLKINVDLKSGTLKYSKMFKAESTQKHLNSDEVDTLIRVIKEVDLLNWRNKYENEDTSEKFDWEIEIVTTGKTLKKVGINKHPKEWEALLSGFETITKDKF